MSQEKLTMIKVDYFNSLLLYLFQKDTIVLKQPNEQCLNLPMSFSKHLV